MKNPLFLITRYKTLLFFVFLVNLNISSQNLDSIFSSKKEIAKYIETDSKKAEFLYDCGNFYYSKSLIKSEYFYKEAILLTNNNNNDLKGKILWKLGLLEKRKGDYNNSLRLLTEAKNIFKSTSSKDRYASILFDIGVLYRYKKQTNKEYKYYNKAIKLIGQKEKTIGKGLMYRGNYYNREKKLDSAIYCFNKALDIFKKLKIENKIYNVYNNLANTHYMQKKYQKVIDTRKVVLKYAKANQNQMLLTINYHNIGASYNQLGEHKKAIRYLDSAINIAKKEKFKDRLSRSYRSRSKIKYHRTKNYKEAYDDFEQYKTYSDSIFKAQLTNRIKEVELKNKFEIERKNLQLINQQQKHEKNLYLFIFVIFFILSLIIVFTIHKSSVKKSKKIELKLKKEKTGKKILSQKYKTSETEIKKLVADNSMRSEFLKQFLIQLKDKRRTTESTEVKNYIKDLSFKVQQQINTEGKLTLLKEKINAVNDGFENKLITICNELTKTEREVCSLLRLNLSIKEIAAIRNSSTNAIKAIRYRIRKKMNIPKNQELEFFIQNIKI